MKKATKAKAAPKKPAPKKAAKKAAPKTVNAAAAPDADWRLETLARVRALIVAAVLRVVEEVKWRKPSNPAGVPTWGSNGLICTGERYKDKVKLTFAKGAALDDPAGVFNGDDKGATRRSIDLREGDRLNERAFKTLVRAAAALNGAAVKKKAKAG